MGYKSKNLSSSRGKAHTAAGETQGLLHDAIANIGAASRGIKSLDARMKRSALADRDIRYTAYAAKRRSDDKLLKRKDYDKWQGKWQKAVSDDEYQGKDNFFPEFDDWYTNRTDAKIGGKSISYSDMNMGNYDVDNINLIMKLMEMNNDGGQ